ncbi:MAG: PEP-CTERM sorting domain-containing protein [Kiritimatiellales bacterium]
MKRAITSIIVTVSLLASGLHAAEYIWNGSVNGDWADINNWEASGIPVTDANGSVINAANTIRIKTGNFAPTINVPTFASSHNVNLTTPIFIIEGGASLSMASYDANSYIGATDMTAVTVEPGGSLMWTVATSLTFGRNAGVQTYNINGTFTVSTPRLNLGYQVGALSHINLDGGTFISTGTEIYTTRSTFASAGDFNRITLDNGSQFINQGIFRMAGEAEGAYQTVQFDIKDTASSITFKLSKNAVRDFATYASVTNSFGEFFISSTLGNDALRAIDNGDDTVTVIAVPEPGTISIFLISGMTLMIYRRRIHH